MNVVLWPPSPELVQTFPWLTDELVADLDPAVVSRTGRPGFLWGELVAAREHQLAAARDGDAGDCDSDSRAQGSEGGGDDPGA